MADQKLPKTVSRRKMLEIAVKNPWKDLEVKQEPNIIKDSFWLNLFVPKVLGGEDAGSLKMLLTSGDPSIIKGIHDSIYAAWQQYLDKFHGLPFQDVANRLGEDISVIEMMYYEDLIHVLINIPSNSLVCSVKDVDSLLSIKIKFPDE